MGVSFGRNILIGSGLNLFHQSKEFIFWYNKYAQLNSFITNLVIANVSHCLAVSNQTNKTFSWF